jgi:hypothetical protein
MLAKVTRTFFTYKLHQKGVKGRESPVNRMLGGTTYPGKKLVPSSLCKKIVFMKHNNLTLAIDNAI